MANFAWEERGRTPIDVLACVYHDGPLSIASDFARAHSVCICALASVGAISNLDLNGYATRQWRITRHGYNLLEQFQ